MRFSLLFLWLALLPALAPASDISLCQPGYFARLTQRYFPALASQLKSKSPTAKAITRAAAGKFDFQPLATRVSHENWLEWKELGDAQRALLESLPKLSAEERAELIPLVRSVQAETAHAKHFRKLLLLGLYDHVAWGGLTTAILEGNLQAHLALSYLPSMAREMPAGLKQEFLKALGGRYRAFIKEKMFTYSDHAPKRMADLYFKHLLRGDEIIHAELKNGRTAREAFGSYVAKVQEYIPGDDHYSAEQALGMMEEARQALRRKMQEGPVSAYAKEPELWVGGSLPNGRATFRDSDIDLSTNVELKEDVRKEIEKGVKGYVAAIRPDSGIHAAFASKVRPSFWTQKHPVAFRIRPSGIDMVVVSPDGAVDIRPIR